MLPVPSTVSNSDLRGVGINQTKSRGLRGCHRVFSNAYCPAPLGVRTGRLRSRVEAPLSEPVPPGLPVVRLLPVAPQPQDFSPQARLTVFDFFFHLSVVSYIISKYNMEALDYATRFRSRLSTAGAAFLNPAVMSVVGSSLKILMCSCLHDTAEHIMEINGGCLCLREREKEREGGRGRIL